MQVIHVIKNDVCYCDYRCDTLVMAFCKASIHEIAYIVASLLADGQAMRDSRR